MFHVKHSSERSDCINYVQNNSRCLDIDRRFLRYNFQANMLEIHLELLHVKHEEDVARNVPRETWGV